MSSDLGGATFALIALISFDRPLAELQEALKAVPVDIPDIVVLTRRDVQNVLQRFVEGELDVQAVEEWANLIEGRDGIGLEADRKNELSEAIHTLANPYLTSQLSIDLARELIHEFTEGEPRHPPQTGKQPDLVGQTCQAIICEGYRYLGKLITEANVVFIRSSDVWHRLLIDSGVIFWRIQSKPPQAWSVPEDNLDYPHRDIGSEFELMDKTINAVTSHLLDEVTEVRISFQDGRAFILHNEDDVSSFRIEM